MEIFCHITNYQHSYIKKTSECSECPSIGIEYSLIKKLPKIYKLCTISNIKCVHLSHTKLYDQSARLNSVWKNFVGYLAMPLCFALRF